MPTPKSQPSSWASSSAAVGQPPDHGSGKVVVRGFNPARGPLLTPVIEAPTPAADDNSLGRHPGADYFGSDALRRRSSFTERLGSLVDRGGVNSLNNFARSWQRAAGFYEITPIHRSFVLDPDGGSDVDENDSQSMDGDHTPHQHPSLLRAALQRERSRRSSNAVTIAPSELDPEDAIAEGPSGAVAERIRSRRDSIFQVEPQLASVFGGSYGATYGSLSSRVNEAAVQHAGRLFFEQQASGVSEPDKEREPLLVKTIEHEDGKLINVVVGQSTIYQTVFNSVNVLIGVGMLALPLAIRYSGWLIGLVFFLFSAVTTSYTAKLLGKCLDVDGSLITFADLAYVSFGPRARVAISILFTLELVATCVALIILFADSMDALIEGWEVTGFKIVCGILIVPLGFLPLRFLSFTSIVGILSCLLIVAAIFIDGFVKTDQPGSLRNPMETYLFPKDWRTLPLAFGLLMAPWGGHSVFPNIYRDMRHPYKYPKAVNYTYVFTYFIEIAIGVAGYLMFGEGVMDELTKNIFLTQGYPRVLAVLIIIAVAIIPLTKIPLNARPIVSTIEIFCGLDARALPGSAGMTGMSGLTRGIMKLSIRILTPVVFVLLAIAIPSFDRIMSLVGSLACFSICIILPSSFHLKIFGKDLSLKQKILDWSLIVICTILGLMGTVCAFLPKRLLGAE